MPSDGEPIFDSHCHLDHPALAPDLDAVIARAESAGIDGVLVPAIAPAGWDGLATLRARWSAVRIAVGVHPHALGALDPRALEDALASLSSRAKTLGAVAIGECGFDRGVAPGAEATLDEQAQVVDAHVEVARALSLPLVLHVVGAHGLALERLERHGALPAGGVVHAFSGAVELVPRWLALGFSISLGPALMRPGARRSLEVARAVPRERLLLETDAPDGHLPGSERGEPADAAVVARIVAQLRGVPEQVVRRATRENALRIFTSGSPGQDARPTSA